MYYTTRIGPTTYSHVWITSLINYIYKTNAYIAAKVTYRHGPPTLNFGSDIHIYRTNPSA